MRPHSGHLPAERQGVDGVAHGIMAELPVWQEQDEPESESSSSWSALLSREDAAPPPPPLEAPPRQDPAAPAGAPSAEPGSLLHWEEDDFKLQPRVRVVFELPSRDILEKTFAMLPSYAELWLTVRDRLQWGDYRLLLDGAALSNANAPGLLKCVVEATTASCAAPVVHVSVVYPTVPVSTLEEGAEEAKEENKEEKKEEEEEERDNAKGKVSWPPAPTKASRGPQSPASWSSVLPSLAGAAVAGGVAASGVTWLLAQKVQTEQLSQQRNEMEKACTKQLSQQREEMGKAQAEQLARHVEEMGKTHAEQLSQQRSDMGKAHAEQLSQQRKDMGKLHKEQLSQQRKEIKKAYKEELSRQTYEMEKAHTEQLSRQKDDLEKVHAQQLSQQRSAMGEVQKEQLAQQSKEMKKAYEEELSQQRDEMEKAHTEQLSQQRDDLGEAHAKQLLQQRNEMEEATNKEFEQLHVELQKGLGASYERELEKIGAQRIQPWWWSVPSHFITNIIYRAKSDTKAAQRERLRIVSEAMGEAMRRRRRSRL